MIDPTVLFVSGARQPGDATASALASDGLCVVTADDQFDAVKRLDDEAIDCVALVTPLGEPSADWFVRYVRRERASLPILLIGSPDDAVTTALAAGANGYVEHDVDRIADRIRELVAECRARGTVERHRALKDSVFEVAMALQEATDPVAVERVVYDRLADVDQFRFVFVGSYDRDADRVRLRFPVGGDVGADASADELPVSNAEFVDRAIETGTVSAIDRSVRTTNGAAMDEDAASESKTDADIDAIAVPFVHADVTYGVVVLGSDVPGATDGSTRSILTALGSLVGRELHRLEGGESAGGTDADVRRFAEGLAHELRNTLGIASTHLELGQEGDDEALERARAAIEEIDRTLSGMVSLAAGVEETTQRELRDAAVDAWESIDPSDAELVVEGTESIEADHDQFPRLLVNLFRNAVEHGSTDSRSRADSGKTEEEPAVTVRVGTLESGFYVEDDGPGVPAAERERVFEWGYAADGGTGIGLGVVEAIADAHGWSVEASEGRSGGARFEVTGVRRPSD